MITFKKLAPKLYKITLTHKEHTTTIHYLNLYHLNNIIIVPDKVTFVTHNTVFNYDVENVEEIPKIMEDIETILIESSSQVVVELKEKEHDDTELETTRENN